MAGVGLLASAVFVGLALHHLDFRSVVAALERARPMPWLPLAVLAYVAGHFVRGQRLRVLVRRDAILHLPTATNVVVVGYASNNVFPARLGEFVRAGMLTERTGMPLSQALTITFIERLLDGVAILGLLLLGVGALSVRAGFIWRLASAASLVFGVAVAGLLVAVLLPRRVLAVATRVSARLGPRARDAVLTLATSVTGAGASLRRPRDAARIGAYSLAVWVLESLMFALILPVFGMKLALAPSIVAMSATNLGILVPSSPGFIGSFHFFCSQALVALGVPAATALGYAFVVHLAFFVPVTLWGAGAILWYGIEVGATAAMARAARAIPHLSDARGIPVHRIARLDPSPRSATQATAFDRAIAEAVVSTPGERLDPVSVAAAAAFLVEETGALPVRLRLLYRAGMAVFGAYARVSTLRGFCDLDLERRRALVQAWAFGRIGLLRQLFRPVRSTVLLAYYDREPARTTRALSLPARRREATAPREGRGPAAEPPAKTTEEDRRA
ncbi:MAG: flippase-like domain-containing protein [Myxococcales bacterium]|nr:flippase-like domain-containing protein [Myxococcales bacterium]